MTLRLMKKETTTATIKALALITMTMDHIPAIIFEPLMYYRSEVLSPGFFYLALLSYSPLY